VGELLLKQILISRSSNIAWQNSVERTAKFVLGANLSLADVFFSSQPKLTSGMRPTGGQALWLALAGV
jgi:hypothetical protein